ncbi:MrcB family domain-containing protein [Heyndrickxia oleronia]|uniref:MrcB family domain-containing protein n=1 Tax=Heyndrickxia oleronia TaxID=38875 RepID=UPI00375010B0
MVEKILLEYAKKINELTTLGTQQPNWIVNVNAQGIYVETQNSRKKFEEGKKSESWDFISKKFLDLAWSEFTKARIASSKDFVKSNPRYSFFMSFFEKLPFVEQSTKRQAVAIKLLEFTTDQLPEASLEQTLGLLNEIIDGKIEPQIISKKISNESEKHLKFRARQGLKILGFLTEDYQLNKSMVKEYQISSSKEEFIRKLIVKHPYFNVCLEILRVISSLSKKEKSQCLKELGMLIVRNSRGENLMLESVANYRTGNMLGWFEYSGLISEEWVVIKNESLRPLFLKVLEEYINAKNGTFGGHNLGQLVRNDIPNRIKDVSTINLDDFLIKGSVGQGNWAIIPWIAIMNKEITNSTQRGYYIAYLFSEDMERLYLTFAQGVTETPPDEMERINTRFRENIKMIDRFKKDNEYNLGTSGLARKYEKSISAYVEYIVNDFPSEEQLIEDLMNMVNYYKEYIELDKDAIEPVSFSNILDTKDLINHIYNYINKKGFFYTKDSIMNLYLSLKTKPFVILSGISGTGKTQIIKLFAESIGATEANGQFKLIPVRPDWSDGSDLIGYEDIKGEFKPGPLTLVLQEANRLENRQKPYFVLLDEMNLARVEYYFSDLLSVMESREKREDEFISTPVVDRDEVGKLMIGNNVYFIGTVNMDETTHPFSPKVLDRANTIEYNDVTLNQFDFLINQSDVQSVAIHNEQLAGEFIKLKDAFSEHESLIREMTDWLVEINTILEKTKSHFGYRVRDEICFYMIYNELGELMSKDLAFDYQIYQKILPRLTGNDVKTEHVLKDLYKFCTNHVWEEGLILNSEEARFPKSAEKLDHMITKIQYDGFTSFWI